MTDPLGISRRQALRYGGLAAAAVPLLSAARRGDTRAASRQGAGTSLAVPGTLPVRQSAPGAWVASQPGPGWSTDGPSLAAFNGRVYMAWMGSGGDQTMWWSSSDGFSWTPQQRISDSWLTNNSPCLAASGGRLYMGWRGANGDMALYWSSSD